MFHPVIKDTVYRRRNPIAYAVARQRNTKPSMDAHLADQPIMRPNLNTFRVSGGLT
jgi:hypothetical protein